MKSDCTVEYSFGFELDSGTDQWYWFRDSTYSKEEAIKKFDEIVRGSLMNWRLREDRIETTIIKESKVQ